jgi:hypothetical protein
LRTEPSGTFGQAPLEAGDVPWASFSLRSSSKSRWRSDRSAAGCWPSTVTASSIIYLQPEITDASDVTFGEPDFGGVSDFLCGEREFSRERVTAALERAFAERSLF